MSDPIMRLVEWIETIKEEGITSENEDRLDTLEYTLLMYEAGKIDKQAVDDTLKYLK